MEPLETTRKKKKSGRGKPIKLRQRSSATPRSGTFAAKKWQTCKDSTEAQRADVREHRRPQVEKRKATSN